MEEEREEDTHQNLPNTRHTGRCEEENDKHKLPQSKKEDVNEKETPKDINTSKFL